MSGSSPESQELRRRLEDLVEADPDAGAWVDEVRERAVPALLDSLADEAGPPRPGDRVAGYRLESVIGHGGMGVVYRAHDERLDRPVALKFLGGAASLRKRDGTPLIEEARAAARLDHPGIAIVHEVSETEDGVPFIVMAHYEGETLAERIARSPLSLEEALDAIRQIADALAAAHRAGVVHRDIKPANVIITPGGRIRVVDFGIAARTGPGSGAPPAGGTVPYMSPERLEGIPTDERADVWALGIVAWEALTGDLPFEASTAHTAVAAILSWRPQPLAAARPDVPPGVAAAVERCLAADPDDRWPSAGAFLDALLEAQEHWPRRRGGTADPVPAGTSSADAFYRRGRHHLDRGDKEGAGKARDAFLRALDADPGHARAWSGLSDAYEMLAYVSALPPREAHLRARAAADRALDLDPDLAEAHVSLATVLLDYYREWDAAGSHYRRALELDPDYAVGRQLYAEYLRDRGRFDEALSEIDEAIRLDPLSPYFRMVRGIILHMARRHDQALEELRSLLRASPDYPMAHFFIGLTCSAAGHTEAALEALDRMDPERRHPDALAIRGVALGRAGRRSEAEEQLAALQAVGPEHAVLPYQEALVRLALGELDQAVALLEADAEERSWFSRILAVFPGLDAVRGHPRFEALLDRVGPDRKM